MAKYISSNLNSVKMVPASDNNLGLVCVLVKLLFRLRIRTCLFGGWAEEINGRSAPRKHKDIDLIYFSDTFSHLDTILKLHSDLFPEITQKKAIHKRAFLYQGVLVEVFLVNLQQGEFQTCFQNTGCFNWPPNLFWQYSHSCGVQIPVASIETLDFYRNNHHRLYSRTPEAAINNGATKSI